jgi:sulfur relay (sulfurtransferase) complex TusBCD TusD component (DsrE family)
MNLSGKKLGILLSTVPTHQNFSHGVRLAETALANGVEVYLYCIDEAVPGISDPRIVALKDRGARLFACAYGAHKRGLPVDGAAIFAGLTVVADLMADTDRFISFN